MGLVSFPHHRRVKCHDEECWGRSSLAHLGVPGQQDIVHRWAARHQRAKRKRHAPLKVRGEINKRDRLNLHTVFLPDPKAALEGIGVVAGPTSRRQRV